MWKGQVSPPVFSRVHVTRSLVLYVCFVDRCLAFCTFSFGHCVIFYLKHGDSAMSMWSMYGSQFTVSIFHIILMKTVINELQFLIFCRHL